MPERSFRTQGTQLGVEVTSGTSVSANKKMLSIDFALGGQGETQQFIPQGNKFATVVAPTREWSTFALSGRPTFDELMYIFAGIMRAPTSSVTGTTGQQHVFDMDPDGVDAVKTFTIEKGDAVRAHKASYCMINDLTLTMNRNEFTLAGNGFGQRISDNITLTATPTVLPQVPVLNTLFDVYVDATRGALGTTKMTRAFNAVFSLGNRFGQIWPMNSTLTSYGAHIEALPTATLTLTLAADATGMAYLTDFRDGDSLYVQIKNTSAVVIGAGPAVYSLTMNFAGKINALQPFEDQDGLYAITFPLSLIDDGAGAPVTATLVNATSAL